MGHTASKVRLLLLTPDYPPAHGGIQLLAHRLAGGLSGFDTRVLTLDMPGALRFDATDATAVRRVGARALPGVGRKLALNAIALLEGVEFRPQITLSTHIVTSPAAAGLRRALGARTVQYFYAKEIADKPRLAAFAARQADAGIAISTYSQTLLAATGASTAAVRLIPPGVDLPAEGPPADGRSPAPLDCGRHPTFVTVARLADRHKGHDVLIRALVLIRERVPDVRWIVLGDGPLRPELEARARACGVADAVRFLGAVSDRERDFWLRDADLLAMPSRLPGGGKAGEGFGIAYLEAGAHGRPVIAGDVGGACDAVLHGETGLLVDPTDARAVADAIVRLLLDRELARRLGAAGARRAQTLAWPAIALRVQALLWELLSASHGGNASGTGKRGRVPGGAGPDL